MVEGTTRQVTPLQFNVDGRLYTKRYSESHDSLQDKTDLERFDKVKKRGTVGPLIVKGLGISHEETSRMVAWSGREHGKE